MSDSFNDDFAPRRSPYMNPEVQAALFDELRALNSDPAADEAMHAYLNSEMGQAAVGVDSSAVVHLEPQSESSQAPDLEPASDASPDSAQATSAVASPVASADATSATTKEPAKPTSLEKTVASIGSLPTRQNRLVISGDPAVEARYWERMKENNWVTYQGGVPIVSVSIDKSIKILNDVAKEMNGGKAEEAVKLEFQRGGDGLLTGAAAALKNKLGLTHRVTVVVVGDDATRASKREELGALVSKMEKAGLVDTSKSSEGDKSSPEKALVDGHSRLTADATSKPLTIVSTARLDTFTGLARDVVLKHQDAEKAKREAKHSEGDYQSSSASSKDKSSAYVSKLASNLSDAASSAAGLTAKNDSDQSVGAALLFTAKQLDKDVSDPSKSELLKLDPAERQKTIVTLAAAVAKADSGEFTDKDGKKFSSADLDKKGLRSKIEGFIAAEKERDPAFEKNAAEITERLLKTGVITDKQAEAMTASFSASATSKDGSEKASGEAPAPSETVSLDKTTAQSSDSTPKDVTAAPTDAPAKADGQAQSDVSVSTSVDSAKESSAVPVAAPTKADALAIAEPSSTPAPTANEPPSKELSSDLAKQLTLSEKIDAMASAGPSSLSRDQASSLVAELDALRTKPLSALDANLGDKPSQTLAQTETLLKDISSGRLGDDLAAQALDLTKSLEKWKGQDASRLDGLKVDASSSTTQPAVLETQLSSAQAASSTPPQEAAQEFRASEAALRLGETEAAAGKLSALMANPPGSFTNKDKSWNDEAIQKAAQEVTRLDTDSVASMSPAARTKLAAYAAWVADGANSGRLPGFDSEAGKELAAKVTDKANALVGSIRTGDRLPAANEKELLKANNMVRAMETRQKSATLTTGTSVASGKSSAARMSGNPNQVKIGVNYAKDLVHAVYKQPVLREAQAKYLLKEAGQLTPAAMNELSSEMKAKAVVALGSLAAEIRNGAMGEFSKLNAGVKNNVIAAQNLSGKLQAEMSQDPSLRTELTKAHLDLQPGASKEAAKGGKAGAAEELAKPAEPKQAGRSMER